MLTALQKLGVPCGPIHGAVAGVEVAVISGRTFPAAAARRDPVASCTAAAEYQHAWVRIVVLSWGCERAVAAAAQACRPQPPRQSVIPAVHITSKVVARHNDRAGFTVVWLARVASIVARATHVAWPRALHAAGQWPAGAEWSGEGKEMN